MSEPNWGLLAKSAVDNETVEEAVDRIVQDHDDDPDAHLDATQSLQSHKAAEIIDHIAGSVIADKLTMSEEITECSFQSMDSWTVVGGAGLYGLNGFGITHAYIAGGYEYVYSDLISADPDYFDFSKNMMLQFAGWVSDVANFNAHIIAGNVSGHDAAHGFGFYLDNLIVKGFWNGTAGVHLTADLGVDPRLYHVYRAYFDADDNETRFYVDGVLLATITYSDQAFSGDNRITIDVQKLVSGQGWFYMKSLLISRQM